MLLVTTLTFGRQKPEDGDKGDTVFTALETNMDLNDAHTHDGVTSDTLSGSVITRSTVAVPNTGWAASGLLFTQAVSFPAGFTTANGSDFGLAQVRFFVNGGTFDEKEFFPKFQKLTATSLTLFMPVSDQAVDVVFM